MELYGETVRWISWNITGGILGETLGWNIEETVAKVLKEFLKNA